MVLAIFTVITAGLCWIDYKKNGYRLSPFTVFAMPYLIIILINNLVAVRYGFFSITDRVIYIVMFAIFAFMMGALTAYMFGEIKHGLPYVENGISKLKYYDVHKILKYTIFVEIIAIIRLWLLMRHGFRYLVENEGIVLSGPVGHLLLTLYVLLPIIFYYWLNNKHCKMLLSVVIVGICLFATTFVKYHVMSLILVMFLFVSFEERKYIKVGVIFNCLFIISLFILNYVLDFFSRGVLTTTSYKFYILHFWKYIAGGLINMDLLLSPSAPEYVDGWYKVLHIVSALPNMFISKVFGEGVFVSMPDIGFQLISDVRELSNVNSFIGFFLPTHAVVIDYLFFISTIFCIGWSITTLFVKAKQLQDSFSIDCFVCMTFFCLLSFFGNYGGLNTPWELIIWAVIIPKFFKIRKESVDIEQTSIS